jgi:hypothetical protein
MANRRPVDKFKALAAIVGAGALVTLGTVGALSVGSSTEAPVVMSVGEMTMGDTETAAYSATEATSMAVPAEKASPPCGFSSSC